MQSTVSNVWLASAKTTTLTNAEEMQLVARPLFRPHV